MKAKSFYVGRSAELHANLDKAHAAVAAAERAINENIRLVNIAPETDDEEAPAPPPPPQVKPLPAAARPATKKA